MTKTNKGGEGVFDWEETGFYKGYVPNKANSKQPGVSYTKEENHIDLKTAEGHNSFSGILDDGSVLMECDDRKNSDLLLKIIEGEQLHFLITNRKGGQGIHSLFIDNGDFTQNYTKVTIAVGVVVDIKIGKRNGLECLKFSGNERTPVYNKTPYQTAPKYLKPLKGCKLDFSDMEAGDGRNSALFSYILTLQREGFTVEEVRECIRIINKYVLKEPVSENELEVILRDGAFKKKAFFNGRTFLHDQFAEYIKNTYHIKKVNGQLHIYKEGVYVSNQEEIEKAMLKEISSLTDAKRKEVIKQLNLICDKVNNDDQNVNLIAFRNGIYDLTTDSLRPFSPDVVITNRIPWDYNPEAYSELADKTLDKIACNDKQVRTILEECIGSCFYRSNTLGGGKAFILTGEGSNGKSTFIAMVQHLLNEDNIAALDLKELDQKFQNTALFGKLANLGDDISDEFIVNASIFKKFVTGERVQVQNKGEKPFEFNNYAKFLFSANNIPRIRDKTGAVLRRLLIVPFNAEFTKNDADYDPGIKYKLQEQEVMEYLIVLGINALKNIIANRKYSDSKKVQEQLDEYRIFNNPIISFVQFCDEMDIPIEHEPLETVYENYCAYCAKRNYIAVRDNEFSKQMKRCSNFYTDRRTVNGKKRMLFFKYDGQARTGTDRQNE
ncbi:DNA primase [bacterium]|nr:DNA primase [bacterium]